MCKDLYLGKSENYMYRQDRQTKCFEYIFFRLEQFEKFIKFLAFGNNFFSSISNKCKWPKAHLNSIKPPFGQST